MSLIGIIASSKLSQATAFESIATATGTGSSGTITFSSIPSTYQHLQLRVCAIADASSLSSFRMEINGVTSSVYSYHQLNGNGTAASATGGATQSLMLFSTPFHTSHPTVAIFDFHDYASTTKNKTVRAFYGNNQNVPGTSDQIIALGSGLYQQTTAISSIKIYHPSQNFTTASTFALYGIKGA